MFNLDTYNIDFNILQLVKIFKIYEIAEKKLYFFILLPMID